MTIEVQRPICLQNLKSKIISLSWPEPLEFILYQFRSDRSSRKANVCLFVSLVQTCPELSIVIISLSCLAAVSQLFLSSLSEILCLVLSISHFQFLWMPDVIIHDLVKFSKPEILNEVAALEIFKNKMVYYKIRYV